jgi:hypothetical protein
MEEFILLFTEKTVDASSIFAFVMYGNRVRSIGYCLYVFLESNETSANQVPLNTFLLEFMLYVDHIYHSSVYR